MVWPVALQNSDTAARSGLERDILRASPLAPSAALSWEIVSNALLVQPLVRLMRAASRTSFQLKCSTRQINTGSAPFPPVLTTRVGS